MPDTTVDPSTLDGDDLARWYRRPLWQRDQGRQLAAAQRYADFFGSRSSAQPNAGLPDQTDQAPPPPGSNLNPFGGTEPDVGFPTSSLLPVSATLAQQSSPPSSLRPQPQANGSSQPHLGGILGSLFPWAIPAPGGQTLKSAEVTSTDRPGKAPDPSRVNVFPQGPDGELNTIPGWRTTGPFDFGAWSHGIDWDGAGHDLSHIVDGVAEVEGLKAIGGTFLDALGPETSNAIKRGVFGPGQGHHPIPRFIGGSADQDLADLAPPIHRAFHRDLTASLRQAGSPPVGGATGTTGIWNKLLQDAAKKELATQILQRTTRNFDIERGTSITPYLDRALGAAKPGVRPLK